MAKPKSDPLLNLDVADRRGVVAEPDVNSWDATLVRGTGLDDVGQRLVRSGVCGAVQRDVTRAALDGKLREPAGKWALLVQLRGHAWVQLAGLWQDYDTAERIAKATKLETMHVGHQDTANATFVQYYAGGKPTIHFESCGYKPGDKVNDPDDLFEGTRFTSDRHDVKWLRPFKSEAEIRHALVAELGAYVPMLYARGDKTISLEAWHEDVLEDENVERIDLAVFGPAEALTAGDASERLRDAIAAHDVKRVRQAIADGADLRFLAGRDSSPLDYAIGSIGREKRKQAVEVVRVLLEAGADPNGDAGANPPIFHVLDGISFDAAEVVELIELLLDHGADVNAVGRVGLEKGQTPLHQAATLDAMPIAKLLVARGADPKKRDAQRRTPRQSVEASVKLWREHTDEEQGEAMARKSAKMIAFLADAEAGRAKTDDVRALAEADRKQEHRRRRKAKVAAAELFDMLKTFGELVGKGSKKAAAKLAVAALPDEIHVEKARGARWNSPKHREVAAARLEKLGFRGIGTFVARETPDLRLLAMIHPELRAYGVVSEMGKTRWVDLVRYHKDGTVLTVTNSDVPPVAQSNLADKPRLRLPNAKPAEMVEALKKKRPPRAGVEEITADEFAARVERFYKEETAARKKQDRGTARRPR